MKRISRININAPKIKSIDTSTIARSEFVKLVKPAIDAANKRLKRQGLSELKLSMKGKSIAELQLVYNKALNVGPTYKEYAPKNRPLKTVKQLPENYLKMSRQELMKIMKPTFDAANKRIKRMKESGKYSMALENLFKQMKLPEGKFSVRGKSVKDIQKLADKAINFMNMKTSTLAGQKSWEHNSLSSLKIKNLTKEQQETFFKILSKVQDINPLAEKSKEVSPNTLADHIRKMIERGSQTFEEMLESADQKVTYLYEQHKKRQYEERKRNWSPPINIDDFSDDDDYIPF